MWLDIQDIKIFHHNANCFGYSHPVLAPLWPYFTWTQWSVSSGTWEQMANGQLLPDFRALDGLPHRKLPRGPDSCWTPLCISFHICCPCNSQPKTSQFPLFHWAIHKNVTSEHNPIINTDCHRPSLMNYYHQECSSLCLKATFPSFFGCTVSVFTYMYTSVHCCLVLLFRPSTHQASTGTGSVLSITFSSLVIGWMVGGGSAV